MIDRKVALAMLGLAAGALTAPAAIRAQQPQAAVAATGPQLLQFTVVGLSCPFCAYGIEKKLRREVVGLDSLGLDFQKGAVTLEMRDGAKVSDADLREVVRKAGFSVQGDIKRAPLGGTRSPGTDAR